MKDSRHRFRPPQAMLARATSATPWGVEARPIQVEVDVKNGLPQMQIVGLPDTAVRESRERVRTAIKNCGFELPPRSVVVNLAPADLRKEGNHLDLAIALALLAASGHLPEASLGRRLFCGELGLDGAIRSIRGGLAIAALSSRLELEEVVLPAANAAEAAALEALPVIAPGSLSDAVQHLVGACRLEGAKTDGWSTEPADDPPDLAEVRGQETAKRALEIAAAGGHNLLLIGPPGAGKTMLARRLPGILPALTRDESVEVTKIHSLSAARPLQGLISQRPFRSPHPGISSAALIGGGSHPRPGEVSLAHAGVLFLDELPEFRRDALEALRQPLEEGRVTVARVRARHRFPARFSLVAAMNPCPCGHLGDSRHECRCLPQQIHRYRNRISGPLLDRIDLHVEVPAVTLQELKGPPGEPTSALAERVAAVRRIQLARFGAGSGSPYNAAMTSDQLRRHCALGSAAQNLLDRAFQRLGLSARSLIRILRVARTIADLAGRPEVDPAHLAEAIQYRTLDRRLG